MSTPEGVRKALERVLQCKRDLVTAYERGDPPDRVAYWERAFDDALIAFKEAQQP